MTERETIVSIRPADRFTDPQIEEMFALHARYFSNVTLERFRADFAEKQWCVIILDRQGRIAGYSTIELIFRETRTQPLLVLFSGDTLVAQESRNANALIPVFVQFTEYLAKKFPDHLRYWLLITKGYRTYRLLPGHLREFYPTYRCATPPDIRKLLETLCLEKFGKRYDAARSIVCSDAQHDFLRPEFAVVPPGRQQNPDVQFFLDTNPGYRTGDELACLARLDKSNIHPSVYRRYIQDQRAPIEE
jgi:hypothetical protein